MPGEQFTEEPQTPLFLLLELIADPPSRVALGNKPLFPFSGPAIDSFNGLHSKSKFPAIELALRGRVAIPG